MADAKPSGPGRTDESATKKKAEDGIVRNSLGQLVRRRTLHTKAGPVITEVNVYEGDYKVGDAVDADPISQRAKK